MQGYFDSVFTGATKNKAEPVFLVDVSIGTVDIHIWPQQAEDITLQAPTQLPTALTQMWVALMDLSCSLSLADQEWSLIVELL